MISVYSAIIAALKADSAVNAIVSGRVYPDSTAIGPENSLFPAVTVNALSETTLPGMRGERKASYMVSCWTQTSRADTEKLADAVVNALNYRRTEAGANPSATRWMREDSTMDSTEPDRHLWRKSITFITWVKP